MTENGSWRRPSGKGGASPRNKNTGQGSRPGRTNKPGAGRGRPGFRKQHGSRHPEHTTDRPPREYYTGIVDHVSRDHAFILVDGLGKDPSVVGYNLRNAWHGDKVKIAVRSKRGDRIDAVVVDIKERKNQKLVGSIVRNEEGELVVMPDHRRLYQPIFLENAPAELPEKEKVLVSITQWPAGNQPPRATLEKRLGMAGLHKAETEALLLQYDLSKDFPVAVAAEAAAIPDSLPAEEIARRKDFRHVTTFTIDPVDAKDFDDALSIQPLPGGGYEIGIHIADVSHYVREDSAIDQEALLRATSVYLVGQVISMLPEKLANNLCSLRPEEERFAFSVVVHISPEGQVHDCWVGETVIRSDKRFTYEEAQKTIDSGEGAFAEELRTLDKISAHLRAARLANGAICFSSRDIHIHLDEAGEPIKILPKENFATHGLIEEFMLLANRLVATRMAAKKVEGKVYPFVYRNHDKPDTEKLEQLTGFLHQLGYKFDPGSKDLPKEINQLLQQVAGSSREHIVQTSTIRSMMQASYSTQNIGHFGLGFSHYTHFTSPIRRYPDLVVHRLVKASFSDILPEGEKYQQIAVHSSLRERVAVEAERASIQYKQAVFLKQEEGKTFTGLIAGMTSWAIFIEMLENKCEGMVRITDLKDDIYEHDPRRYAVTGQGTGRTYRLGDEVMVRIAEVDMDRKQVRLAFVQETH